MLSTPPALLTTVKRVLISVTFAGEAADRYEVADLHRLVEQDDEARHVIRSNLLESEA